MTKRLQTLIIAVLAGTAGCFPPAATTSPTPTGTPTPAPAAALGKTPVPSPTSTPNQIPVGNLKTKATLVITKLTFNGTDVVAEIKNLSAAAINLVADNWQICGNFQYSPLSPTRSTIGSGAAVSVHVNAPAGCVETDANFCPAVATNVSAGKGNLSLYSGIAGSGDFSKPEKMADFVEWGESGQAREDAAQTAKLWLTDTFVQPDNTSAKISVVTAGQSGSQNWQ